MMNDDKSSLTFKPTIPQDIVAKNKIHDQEPEDFVIDESSTIFGFDSFSFVIFHLRRWSRAVIGGNIPHKSNTG